MAKLRMSQQDAQTVARTMQYSREWFCQNKLPDGTVCGARLAIRAKDDREDGKSNYIGVYPPNHPDIRKRGHSVVPTGMLNWNGMAEERGWIVEPEVKCPACQSGLLLKDYLDAKLDAEAKGIPLDKHIASLKEGK